MTLDATWRKNMYSHTNGCLEVIHRPGYVVVRDSQDPDGPTVPFTSASWASLLMDVAAGHFHWSRFAPLRFDRAERAAFEAGVVAGEFDPPADAEVPQ